MKLGFKPFTALGMFALVLILACAVPATSSEKLPGDIKWLTNSEDPEFASRDAVKGGTFRDWIQSFPMTFREVGPDSNGAFANHIHANRFTLIDLHPNTENIVPQLATHWAFGDDNRTMYFKLNPEAMWSDGKPVTSGDYVYAVDFLRSREIVSPYYNHYYTEEIEKVVAYDDYTIAVVSSKAVPDLNLKVNMWPVPKHFYGKPGKDFVRKFNWKIAPNTGPYQISRFKKGKFVEFKRKKDWWARDLKYYRNRFNVDRVVFTVIRDFNVAWEYFRKGRLDSFRITFPNYWHDKSDIPEVKKGYINKIWFYNDTRRSPQGIYLNCDNELLKDPGVRCAIAHAVNYEKVLNQVLRGDYERLDHAFEGYGDYSDKTIRARTFDPETVSGLLTERGWSRGDDGIWVKGGRRLSLTLTYSGEVVTRRFVVVKEEAKKAGVEIRLEKLDGASSFKKILEKKHEMAMMAWTTNFRPSYWQAYHSDNAHKPQTNNITNADDPELDALIERYDDSLDSRERQELSLRIQALLHENCYFIPTVKVPYFRHAYWRWWRMPLVQGTKNSGSIFDPFKEGLFWFDEKIHEQTRKSLKKGKVFKPVTIINKTYKGARE